MNSHLFFPQLNRRSKYRLTRTGTYYADYNRYRQEIREDCLGRCVYCDCHENELGGQTGMHLDHFRPKGLNEYINLISDPNNLVWACSRCNRLKSDHWPAVGTDGTILNDEGFIDPFLDRRTDYFQVHDDGELIALRVPATYMIGLLGLNSHTPRRLRKMRIELAIQLEQMENMLREYKDKPNLSVEDHKIVSMLVECMDRQITWLDLALHDS